MPSLETADGRRLAYRRLGTGPIVVCHPGGPGFPGRYFGDVGGLDRSLTLVSLDPRGSGGSSRPEPPSYTLEDYAADLEELRAGLGLERMTVLGHSHGGFVAMTWAAQHPPSVDRLVLVGTFARFSPEVRVSIERSIAAAADEPWYDDALAAREARQRFEFEGDEELVRLYAREFRFQFPTAGERLQEVVAAVTFEPPSGEALQFFNTRLAPTFDPGRSSPGSRRRRWCCAASSTRWRRARRRWRTVSRARSWRCCPAAGTSPGSKSLSRCATPSRRSCCDDRTAHDERRTGARVPGRRLRARPRVPSRRAGLLVCRARGSRRPRRASDAAPARPSRHGRLRPAGRRAGLHRLGLRRRPRGAARAPRARGDRPARTLSRRRGGDGLRGEVPGARPEARVLEHPGPLRPRAAGVHEAALAARADEPWYEDARSALAAEEAGDYEDGTELARLVAREMPLFFASFGERERAHAQRLGSEPMCADALRLFNAEELSTFDLRPELPRIRAETLVLVGAEDVVTGPSCADAIAEGIRGSRVLVIQGAGHQTYVEQPEAFCRAVLGFLERSNGP